MTTYMLFIFLVLFSTSKLISNICLSGFSILFVIIGVLLVKKNRARDIHRKEVTFIVVLTALVAIVILSLLGLHFGYYRNSISLKKIYTYILPISITIISTEIFRSVFLAQKQKSVRILSYILCVFIDILLFAEKNPFRNVSSFMTLFAFVFLPAFTSNLLYYRLSFQYGACCVIPYRLIMALYSYLLPFKVAMPNALFSFFKIIFPLFVFLLIKILFDKRVMIASHKHSPIRKVLSTSCIILMFISIAFIANLFRYRPIVVATNSMKGALDRGDVVVYEVYKGQYIENGQVILFKHNNSIIIHRVVDIKKINGEYRYYTKGDANHSIDTGYITNEDIIGITTMKIKYIGYPTVWLNDIFRNKK